MKRLFAATVIALFLIFQSAVSATEGDLLKITAIAADNTLRNRVAAAISQTAESVIANGGATANNKAFAKIALMDPMTEAQKWRWVVAADATVLSHSADLTQVTDANIASIMATYWPILWA